MTDKILAISNGRKELKNFEEDFVHMIEKVKFYNVNDKFLFTLDNDLKILSRNIHRHVFWFADKSRIHTNIPPDEYRKD